MPDTLPSRLESWKPFVALVVGDFMLDELVYGDAERLSPDAPVPVLLVRKREFRPGGASNVCMDLAALRGHVFALGVTGDDPTAERLRAALADEGVDASGLIPDPARPTTLKQNLIGLAQARHPQKMFRVDEESREPVAQAVQDRLFEAFARRLPTADVVVIEDYGKGVCGDALSARLISAARKAGKPVFVDPARNAPAERYRGATTITPNRNEAEQLAGGPRATPTALAEWLRDRMELETVVLTLDKEGALLLEQGRATNIPTRARQVYDVSGAGDMFIAGLAAARANGLTWAESTRFANAAAGLEVEVFGVVPIPFEQVRQGVLREAGVSPGKVRTPAQAVAEVEDRRRRGQKVVFTNGCFDVLHSGHVTLLEKSAACGDYLVVGLNCDESVRRLKGPSRPVNNEQDRARVLGALESVGCVVLFGGAEEAAGADEATRDTPLRLIAAIKPDVLVKGADYTRDRVVGADIVERHGGRVELIDLVAGKSTTGTIAKMRGA
ncbi:MAG: bifunctional heptose 7-phosphate kinase/heptose 1-phosphate adenyltransferase [Phycisphaerales bacterium]